MLVYANSFDLNPPGGLAAVVAQIATWVRQTRKNVIDRERLAKGIRELKFADGAALSSHATIDDDGLPIFPYHFCVRLMHSDSVVPGRRWVTEIGIRQMAHDDVLHCSVLLKTDEISTRVTAPIQVTRPRIVELLITNCTPVGGTPSLSVIRVTEENAAAFAYEIEHESRKYPLVEISCDREGHYPISPERLRSLLIGIAQVVEIPAEADTFNIEVILGRKYSSFGGAINIIFPFRKTDQGGFCKTVLLLPDKIREIKENSTSIESEVLGIITHQTNLPHSWRHTSSDLVGQAILRAKLQRAARSAHSSEELAAYETLLQEAADKLQEKDNYILQIFDELDNAQANLDDSKSQIDGLKHALAGVESKPDVETEKVAAALVPLREAVRAVLAGHLSLEQALRLSAVLFSDRIVILDTAFESAKDSDRQGFRHGKTAAELLMKLCNEYWIALANGGGDQQAKTIFGNNVYAAKESENLSKDGRRRRDFIYLGQNLFMEKHLKHGVKDSAAETLRIHFKWLADPKKLVIGHCGKHLDF
ncbi:hypothetical protein WG926_15315 [Tistrella sp. BH-R2-4]|uniref:Uncharacterized protein n=1 Tax=Tistrella arctica TaxID=3133430 RepID=A0ABU9YLJ8_9PROT